MENNANQNYGQDDRNFQDKPQTNNLEKSKLNEDLNEVLYIDNEEFPGYGTNNQDSNADYSLSNYSDDNDLNDYPEDEEESDEDDIALEEENELEEEINSNDSNPDDEINPEGNNKYYLRGYRKNYFSVFDL